MGRLFWAWLAGFALAVAGISVVFLWTCAKGNHKILRMTESDSPWKTTCITNITNIIFWGFGFIFRNLIRSPKIEIDELSDNSQVLSSIIHYSPGHHPRPLRFNPLVFGMASEIGEGYDPREALKVVEELSAQKMAAWVVFFFLGGLRKAILEGSVF